MTGSLSVFATSHFQQHSSGLSTLSVATSLIGSVSLPFLAKGGDVFGRPGVYGVCMTLQVIGYVITLKSPTLAACTLLIALPDVHSMLTWDRLACFKTSSATSSRPLDQVVLIS